MPSPDLSLDSASKVKSQRGDYASHFAIQRMLPHYTQSFGRLLFVGFLLVTLPLMAGLISNAFSIDRLTGRSERAVYEAVQMTQASQRLLEITSALEHNARQLLIVPAPELFDAYTQNRQSLQQIVEELSALPIDNEQRQKLNQIVSIENGVYQALPRGPNQPPGLRAAVLRFRTIDELVQEIAYAGNDPIDRDVETFRATASKARNTVYWELLVLVPLVVLTAIAFAWFIGRPIRELDNAIERLGNGQLTEAIHVGGPQDLKHLGRRLEWMRGELINIEREKNRFLREISHALKTPLAALREGTALLTEEALGKLTSEQQEIAEILRRNSIELQQLIEGLLDYDAVQFRRTRIRYTKVETSDLAHRIVDSHRLALKAREIKLELVAPRLNINVDVDKVIGILDNLLSNAIKYSPDNGKILLKMEKRGEQLVIDIIDEGPGVASQDRASIFDLFYRGHIPPAAAPKGSGVGLSIARDYAIAHGGNVNLMDSKGGAHFRATLIVEA